MKVSIALSVLIFAACDPGYVVNGWVADGDGGLVSGWDVELNCPGSKEFVERMVVATDLEGRFEFSGVGTLDENCMIKAGETEQRQVAAVCREQLGVIGPGTCQLATVELIAR